MATTPLDINTLLWADEMMCICRSAVRKAQEESRRLGVPNVYFINGQRYYELPNGDYCRTLPESFDKNGH